MAETPHFMTIGEFSSLTRLSVRMLRHYDTHRVLVPAHVDPVSGYRRYAPSQLADAADIRNLRDVGFAVSAMPALLATRGTPGWAQALRLQRVCVLAELTGAQARLQLIDRLIDEGNHMSVSLSRITIAPTTVVVLRGVVPTYADEGQLWAKLMPQLGALGITPTGPCGCFELNDEYTERDVHLAIFVPVTPEVTVAAPLEVHHLPARDCVVAEVVGPYALLPSAHDAIATKLRDEGLARATGDDLSAKHFNLYLNGPQGVPEAEFVTQVYMPLR